MCMSSLNQMFKYVVQYENISDNADTGYCLIEVMVMFLLFNFLALYWNMRTTHLLYLLQYKMTVLHVPVTQV